MSESLVGAIGAEMDARVADATGCATHQTYKDSSCVGLPSFEMDLDGLAVMHNPLNNSIVRVLREYGHVSNWLTPLVDWQPSLSWDDAIDAARRVFPEHLKTEVFRDGSCGASDGEVFRIDAGRHADGHIVWTAGVYEWNDDDYYTHYWHEIVEATDQSGPLAICQAILKFKRCATCDKHTA